MPIESGATTPKAGPASSSRNLSGPAIVGIVVASLILLAIAGFIGYTMASHPNRLVRVNNTFDGTVAKLNTGQTSGCITDGNGASHCGGIVVVDNVPLQTGEHVRVAEVTAKLPQRGLSFNEMFVYDPNRVSY